MNTWLLLFPIAGGLLGWLFNSLFISLLFYPRQPRRVLGFQWQGLIPKNQSALARNLGEHAKEWIDLSAIRDKISDPANLERLMPMIEKNVDEFLNKRLTKELPVLSMFIGDKTIASVKKVFMKELENLFPQIMTQFAGNLEKEFDPGTLIRQKIEKIPAEDLEKIVRENLSSELKLFRVIGLISGFLIGLACLGLLFLLG